MNIIKCRHPSTSTYLALRPEEKHVAADFYFTESPELITYEEVEMSEEEFKNLPEFEA